MREHVHRHQAAPARAGSIVSRPADDHEREADRIADDVLRTPGPRADATRPQAGSAPASGPRADATRPQAGSAPASGQPLDAETRAALEPRFGFDFSQVRVHADTAAAESARALGARAYTAGRDIVFGAGQFAPHTADGRRLLAHELVHVVQQRAAPATTGGAAVAASRAGGVIQRQPAPARTPADNVKDAIALLATTQPIFIHQALSAVTVDGGSVQVHQVQHALGGKPVVTVFTLQVKVAPLSGFTLAQFQVPAVPTQTGDTRTFPMTITVSNTAAGFPPISLARDLFHEGMHMQLFVDRTVPSWGRSRYLKGFEDYLATARKNDNHTPLLTELTAFIVKGVKGKTRAAAAAEAKQIVETMLEEKYVIDTTEQNLNKGRSGPADPVDRLRRVTRWLVTYLGQVGVTVFPPDDLRRMAGRMVSLWLEVDANAPRPPLYPTPMGLHDTGRQPDILPAPLPAALKP